MKILGKFLGILVVTSIIVFAENWEVIKEASNAFEPAYVPNSVFFLDENIGWATGHNGVVIHTENGGDSWIRLRDGEDEPSWNDIQFYNQSIGYACADEGLIYKTDDGGNNWSIISDASDYTGDLAALDIIDNNTVYFCGDDSTLFKTIDGGESLNRINYDFSGLDLNCGIKFTNQNIGVVVSDDNGGQTWYTHDGGESWHPISLSPYYPVTAIIKKPEDLAACSDSTFIITGWHNVTLVSHDGGMTYTLLENYSKEFVRNSTVSAVSENTFYLGGSEGHILKTQNGGSSWDTLSTGSGQIIRDIDYVNENTGFVFQNNGQWYKTNNGGDTWNPVKNWPILSFKSLSLPKEGMVIVTAHGGGELTITNDGGNTWTHPNNFATHSTSNIYESNFVDANNGVIAGSDGFLAKTDDGGETWNHINNPMQDIAHGSYKAIKSLNENVIYAGGSGGNIYRTNNGGINWSESLYSGDEDILDIWCFSEENAVAAAENKIIYMASDSDSFSVIFTTDVDINAVDYSNGYGIFVADDGYIFRDDGNTIDTVYKEESDINLDDVEFVNDDLIYAVGNEGCIIKSEDRGLNWTKVDSPTENGLYKIKYGFNKIWAVGNSGTILKKDVESSIENKQNITTPAKFVLSQNYPNPFNSQTKIKYTLAQPGNVEIKIFDLQGKQIDYISGGLQQQGVYVTGLNADNYSSGIYFYSLLVNGKCIDTKRMVLLK